MVRRVRKVPANYPVYAARGQAGPEERKGAAEAERDNGMKRLSPGATGWVCVGAVVITAELLDSRTMSDAFREASRHPVYGPVVFAGWAILSAHLIGAIPPHYDPINLFWNHTVRRGRVS